MRKNLRSIACLGALILTISPRLAASQPQVEPPSNDDCVNATAIDNGIFTGTTIGATNDGHASCEPPKASPDVWFRYGAPLIGDIAVNTFGSGFDTVLSVHTSCPGTAANEIACNDDGLGQQSAVSFFSFPGEEVWFRVSGADGASGPFTLTVDRTGVIAGTVTEAAMGTPVAGLQVEAFNVEGSLVSSTLTGILGGYELDGLQFGDHFVTAYRPGSLIGELHEGFPCPGGQCDPLTGTPFTVELGTFHFGVRFDLEFGAALAGTVTDAQTGEPLVVQVEVTNSDGMRQGLRNTDAEGNYFIGGLAAGDHFVSVVKSGYVNEIYDSIPCPFLSCDPTIGTPITLDPNVTTHGIDFTLDPGGMITGKVTDDTGHELADVRLVATDAAGNFLESSNTDAAGDYSLGSRGLPTGSYFVRTSTSDYHNEVYDDLPCPPDDCDPATGTPIQVSIGETTPNIDFALIPLPPPTCAPSATALCLGDDRFRVEVEWQDFIGQEGQGRAVELTSDTGYFWFFSPANVEMVVKVLDGCFEPFNTFWVFAGGLTDVGAQLTVTDALTGEARTYSNQLGTAFEPIQDLDAFATCAAGARSEPTGSVADALDLLMVVEELGDRLETATQLSGTTLPKSPGACIPNVNTLCLNEGRFEVTALWDTGQEIGDGRAVLLTDDTGYFWFFSPANIEAMVKVLDACQLPGFGNFWVFAAGLTDVEVTLRVTDTETFETREWVNPRGTAFQPIRDTGSFQSCP